MWGGCSLWDRELGADGPMGQGQRLPGTSMVKGINPGCGLTGHL